MVGALAGHGPFLMGRGGGADPLQRAMCHRHFPCAELLSTCTFKGISKRSRCALEGGDLGRPTVRGRPFQLGRGTYQLVSHAFQFGFSHFSVTLVMPSRF